MGKRPRAPGIPRVELAGIEIDTPEDLRRHAAALREQQRRPELDRLADEYSFEQARLFEELIKRGPEAVEGFFLKLDDPRFATSGERSYGRREVLHDRLMRLAQMFSDRGKFDTAPMDTSKLIDALVNTFLPAPEAGQERVSYMISDDGAPGELERAAPNDAAADESPPPDEDALGG
jgi:hypothetical protein